MVGSLARPDGPEGCCTKMFLKVGANISLCLDVPADTWNDQMARKVGAPRCSWRMVRTSYCAQMFRRTLGTTRWRGRLVNIWNLTEHLVTPTYRNIWSHQHTGTSRHTNILTPTFRAIWSFQVSAGTSEHSKMFAPTFRNILMHQPSGPSGRSKCPLEHLNTVRCSHKPSGTSWCTNLPGHLVVPSVRWNIWAQ
jgi:hypothetical protein